MASRSKRILVSLTLAQAEALLFACSNTLVEPANFERGTGHQRTETPLRNAHKQIQNAFYKAGA